MPVRNQDGQAMIEYLVVFIFIAMLSMGLVKGLNTFLTASFGKLGSVLSNQLHTGVCPTGSGCLYGGYTNN